jgi:hypothetical protein
VGAVEVGAVLGHVEGVIDVDDLADIRLHGQHVLGRHRDLGRDVQVPRQVRAHHRLGDGHPARRRLDVAVVDAAPGARVHQVGRQRVDVLLDPGVFVGVVVHLVMTLEFLRESAPLRSQDHDLVLDRIQVLRPVVDAELGAPIAQGMRADQDPPHAGTGHWEEGVVT